MKINNNDTINAPKSKSVRTSQTQNGQGPDYKDIIKRELEKLDKSSSVAGASRIKSEKLSALNDPNLSISPEDRDRMLLFEKVLEAIMSLPETDLVREAKVEKIKQLIKSGKYNISPEKVAE